MKTLSIVVPCFNSADYLERCVDSLLAAGGRGLEIVIVDDGSTDATGALADGYQERYPELVRVIHTPNGGHGSAVNAGIDAAGCRYLRVVDSDDWVDPDALSRLLQTLAELDAGVDRPDLVVTDFVYEKAGRRHKRTVRYGNALPRRRVIGWQETRRFRHGQYMLMHALTYRTQLLRDTGYRLPAHTFYVDNLFASVPLARVRSLYYLDETLYHYAIGRPDQSVNEAVMLRRLDQQLRVTDLMREELPADGSVHPNLRRYLLHYFGIVCAVTSLMMIRSGTERDLSRKRALWSALRDEHPTVYDRVRRSMVGHIINLPGRAGRRTTVTAYQVARWVVGFN